MPLINHVRGDQVPDAMLNVRTPIVRTPLWLVIWWWLLKGCIRLVVAYVRFWYLTVPATLLGWLYVRFGWPGPLAATLTPAVALTVWAVWHRPSYRRFVWLPMLGRWRRMRYRRGWHSAMVTARLAVTFDGHTILPVLKRVRCTGVADILTVRMVTGQIPDDFATVGERLAATFGALGAKVLPGAKPELVTLVLRRRDVLAAVRGPLPVPAVPDFTALPIAYGEDGTVYRLRLFGTQVLIAGATGAGKGSVIWSILRALAAGIRTGIVHVWAFDPKGGMELGGGQPLYARFARKNFDAMADMLDEAVTVAQQRADRLCGIARQHIPTVDEPLIVIVIDELAALTAYTDRKLKDRIKQNLGLLLTQGRAVGVHVVAALQDPRKEALPYRNLFPTRIGLRLSEEAEVDMTLGEGVRDRGALCDRIPKTTPGVGYVVLDGDPAPMRIRFGYLTDADIATMAHDYGPRQAVEGEVVT